MRLEVGDYMEFAQLMMSDQSGPPVTAELAIARRYPDSAHIGRLSIGKVHNAFMTLSRWRFTLLAALQNSFVTASRTGHNATDTKLAC